jgi:hypothetical protein
LFASAGDPNGANGSTGSGVDPATVPNARTFTTGGFHTASGTVTDRAGNQSAPATLRVAVDTADPVLTATVTNLDGTPYVPGRWTSQNVVVTFVCSDRDGSGVGSLTPPVTVSSEGAGQSASGSCSDNVGRSVNLDVHGIEVDKTAPRAPTTNVDRPPEYVGATGSWWKDVVSVSFASFGDPPGGNGSAGSGVDPFSIPAPVTFATNGSHTASGTIDDLAGNRSAPANLTVHVDTVAPLLTVTYSNADGTAYVPGTWTNQAVTATFACSDPGGAGVASLSPPATVSTPGVGQSVTGGCSDNVGHTTTRSFGLINVDRTPPAAYLRFDPSTNDLLLFARDGGGSGVAAGPIAPSSLHGDERTYRIVDGAGNTFAVVIKVKVAGHELQASFVSFRSDGGPTLAAPDSDLHYVWDETAAGSLRKLEQDVALGKGRSMTRVDAKFDAKQDETTVDTHPGGRKSTFTGLLLLKIAAADGVLAVESLP